MEPVNKGGVAREQLMEKVVALCRRRGFVFGAGEIYGGINALYDYGPYGVALKRAIRDQWWKHIVDLREDVVGLESTIIMHPETWRSSGHLATFTDPMVECRGKCRQRFRADHLASLEKCPVCDGPLTEPRDFNLMFKTNFGPVADSASEVHLRPETAQGMFSDFRNVVNSMRVKLPFGIAQIGKSFRNEISPGNFLFRLREFEQMEMEFFIKPGDDERWFAYWRAERMRWYVETLGIRPERLRFRDHPKEKLSHYARATTDIEYQFPFGWDELEGIANRGDYDLRVHQEGSRQDLTYFDAETSERYLPWVIEPAVSIDRILVMLLLDAYDEEPVRDDVRVVLRLQPEFAPVQVAVMPLSKKEDLIGVARETLDLVRGQGFRVEYDQTGGNIGKRYRRQDEIGTPFCVTVDFESLEDRAVTIRERDSMAQQRVPIAELASRLRGNLAAAPAAPSGPGG